MPWRHNNLANRERRHAAASQLFHKFTRRRVGEDFVILASWPVQHRAVLGHDAIEKRSFRKNLQQFSQLAARRQDHLAPGSLHSLQSLHGARRAKTVVSDGAVVIACETEI